MKLLKVFALALICAGSVSLVSCEKCTTCTFGAGVPDTELCGKKSDVETFEETAEAAGATCTRD